jgi:OOP family OmpA-OmpF porin
MKIRLLAMLALLAVPVVAQEKIYKDSRGKAVRFPLGDRSFADEVVSLEEGKPAAQLADARDPKHVLGPPDYDESRDTNYVTLGCGGRITVKFTDNVLVDVPGPDLYIFEIGPDVEPMHVEISRDGKAWVDAGKVGGGTAEVDIAKFVKSGDIFHYVRITDLKSACGGRWPGADIDAVGALGGAINISLKSSVLFDTNESTLKPAAREELRKAAEQIRSFPGAKMRVEGHTDNVGGSEANERLSVARAQSVREFFLKELKINAQSITASGYGASRPVAPNDTAEGREKNRRVEILLIPGQ